MVATVTLKHTTWNQGEKTFYFYDGELIAKDGVLEIPADRPEWIQRAWIMGYRLDAEGKEVLFLNDLVSSEGEQNAKKSSHTRRRATS